jgi:tryptophan synthase alpha chain
MPPRLVVYFSLGDPAVAPDLLDVYADEGVDVAECGWPARRPYLDGPDVAASMARAVAPEAAWEAARAASVRTLLMAYAEPEGPPLDAVAGAWGLLAVAAPDDPRRLALEAAAQTAGACVCAFLPLPLTPADVLAARGAGGYVMLQAAPGVTGPRPTLDPANAGRLADLRAQGVSAPIVLGFGVSNGEQARAAVALGADGVVVGSAALRAALQGRAALAKLLRDLRRGLDG